MILSTSHVSKVFTTSIVIFEDTPDRQKTVMPTGFQILNQIKPLEEANVEPVEEAINQLVTKGQCNLRL